jgi:hypothetical protein
VWQPALSRCHNLGEHLQAIKAFSHGLDPNRKVKLLQSCPMPGPTNCGLGGREAVVHGHPDQATSSRSPMTASQASRQLASLQTGGFGALAVPCVPT